MFSPRMRTTLKCTSDLLGFLGVSSPQTQRAVSGGQVLRAFSVSPGVRQEEERHRSLRVKPDRQQQPLPVSELEAGQSPLYIVYLGIGVVYNKITEHRM